MTMAKPNQLVCACTWVPVRMEEDHCMFPTAWMSGRRSGFISPSAMPQTPGGRGSFCSSLSPGASVGAGTPASTCACPTHANAKPNLRPNHAGLWSLWWRPLRNHLHRVVDRANHEVGFGQLANHVRFHDENWDPSADALLDPLRKGGMPPS